MIFQLIMCLGKGKKGKGKRRSAKPEAEAEAEMELEAEVEDLERREPTLQQRGKGTSFPA
jgi:hypothetical protein